MPPRINLSYVLKSLPPGASWEESLELLPQARPWLERERQRLEGMYLEQESLAPQGVVGCDEVGRGPLAGPLVAGAVLLEGRVWLPGLNDSKKLKPLERQVLAQWIKMRSRWALREISVQSLNERANILASALEGMALALGDLELAPQLVAVDGSQTLPNCPYPQRAVIKGDGRLPAIAAASILAKVYRDQLLEEAHLKWPQYAWAENKGYGTAAHLEALRLYGPSPYHRLNFEPVRQAASLKPRELSLFDEE